MADVIRIGSVLDIHSNLNSSSQVVTVPADATLVLVGPVGYNWSGGAGYFTNGAVTLNSVAFTLIRADDTTDEGNTALFRLLSPATGNQTLAWDWKDAADPTEGVHIFVAFFKGNDGTNPIKSSGGQQTTGNTATTGSMAAATDDLVFAVCYKYMDYAVAWTGATEISHDLYVNCSGACAEVAPSAAVTISVYHANNDLAITGCVIAASSAPPPPSVGRIRRRQPGNRISSRDLVPKPGGAVAAIAAEFFEAPAGNPGDATCAWGAAASWAAAADVAVSAAAAWGVPHGEAAAASVSITGAQGWSAPGAWGGQTSVVVGAVSAWAAAASWASQASVTVGTTAAWNAPGAWSSQASVAVAAAAAWGAAGAWSGQASLSITAASAWERPGSWSVASSVALSATMAWERSGSWAGAGDVAITGGSAWERPASWDAGGSVAITATAAWSAPASWSATVTVGGGGGGIEATCQWGAPGSWESAAAVEVGVAAAFAVPGGWSAATSVDVAAVLAWSAPGAWAAVVARWAPGRVALSFVPQASVGLELAGRGDAACALGHGFVVASHRRTSEAIVELTAAAVEVTHNA